MSTQGEATVRRTILRNAASSFVSGRVGSTAVRGWPLGAALVVLAGLSSACDRKAAPSPPPPPEDASAQVAGASSEASAGGAVASSRPARSVALTGADLDCFARAMELTLAGDGSVDAALVPQTPLPDGAQVVGRAYTSTGGQVLLFGYSYPLAGFVAPHLRDLELQGAVEGSSGVGAVAHGAYLLRVDAGTGVVARGLAERVRESACW